MPALVVWVISAALILIFLAAVVYFAFWIIRTAAPQEPINQISRLAVMIIALIVLFWLVIQMGPPPALR